MSGYVSDDVTVFVIKGKQYAHEIWWRVGVSSSNDASDDTAGDVSCDASDDVSVVVIGGQQLELCHII